MLTRRQFLKVGIASGFVLAGAGWIALRRGRAPAPGQTWLDASSATIVTALVPVVLHDAIPADGPPRQAAIHDVVSAFDRAVAGLSPAVQEEVAQLFSLLGLAAGRFVVAGVRSGWREATVDEVAGFLRRWRTSRLQILRAGYQALAQLIVASWYGNPASWERIGYPGPPELDAGPA